MTSKLLVLATATGCIVAAGVGSYMAVRSAPAGLAAPATVAANTSGAEDVAPTRPDVEHAVELAVPSAPAEAPAVSVPRAAAPRVSDRTPRQSPVTSPSAPVAASVPADAPASPMAAETPVTEAVSTAPSAGQVESAPVPAAQSAEGFEDVEVPAEAVLGIRIEKPISSERNRVEDPVTARLSRDVTVNGRTVIPAGTEVSGYVTLVDRGGRIRERARLGVKFTAIVLDDRTRIPIDTPTIFREGELKTSEASGKIGASAVIGGILGGLVGGKRGAAIGGAAGAAGGTAAVMAGDRSEASLAAGAMVTLRLSEALVVRVDR